MSNKHEGMVKEFTQLSKAYYGKRELEDSDHEDEIVFGYYSPNETTTTGEMSVQWVRLKYIIVSEIYSFYIQRRTGYVYS